VYVLYKCQRLKLTNKKLRLVYANAKIPASGYGVHYTIPLKIIL
jgi:hypothetical protein